MLANYCSSRRSWAELVAAARRRTALLFFVFLKLLDLFIVFCARRSLAGMALPVRRPVGKISRGFRAAVSTGFERRRVVARISPSTGTLQGIFSSLTLKFFSVSRIRREQGTLFDGGRTARFVEPFAMVTAELAYGQPGGPALTYRFEKLRD